MIAVRLLRDRSVVREAVFSELPISIGRGGDNDFVVSDSSVSRRHARIEQDDSGMLGVRDLGSRNGMRAGGKIVTATALAGRLRLRLGLAELEIEPLSETETKKLRREDWRLLSRQRGALRTISSLLIGMAGWLALRLLDADIWSPWQKSRSLVVLTNGIVALLLFPILAFVLLIILRTVGRPVRMHDTLAFLARSVWLLPLSALVACAAYYPLSFGAYSMLSSVLSVMVAIVVISLAASLRRPRSSLIFRLVWSTALAVIFAALFVLERMEQRRNGVPQVGYEMQMPLAGYAGRAQPLDAYLTRLKQATADATIAAHEAYSRQEQTER